MQPPYGAREMVRSSSWLLDRREVLEQRLSDRGLLHTLSAARYQLHRAVTKAIDTYAAGRVLEAGAGHSPYRESLKTLTQDVVTLDVDASKNVDVLADVQDMGVLTDEAFDTVLSTQVFEHLPRPLDAMKEIRRVLKTEGVLILTAPHLSMIHDAPHDYFRYTRFGLTELCRASDMEIIELRPVGGLLSFVGHAASLGLLTIIGAIPGLLWLSWAVNYLVLVRLTDVLDRLSGTPSRFARDYILIARRPRSSPICAP